MAVEWIVVFFYIHFNRLFFFLLALELIRSVSTWPSLTQSLSFFLHQVLMSFFGQYMKVVVNMFRRPRLDARADAIPFITQSLTEEKMDSKATTHFIGDSDICIRPCCQGWHAPCFNKKKGKAERTPPFSTAPHTYDFFFVSYFHLVPLLFLHLFDLKERVIEKG